MEENCRWGENRTNGLVAAISILAAKRGFDVCINYKSNRERALEVARLVESQGWKVLIHKADIADESEILELFSAVDLSLGRVTALVNNGGVNGNKGRVDQLTAVDISVAYFKLTWTGPYISPQRNARFLCSHFCCILTIYAGLQLNIHSMMPL